MILVTGGAGYVGSVLVQKLLDRGQQIRIFDRFYFGEKSISSFSNKVDIVRGDVRSFPENVLGEVETIIYLAGLSNDPTAEFNPEANYQINTEASVKIAKLAKEKGIKRFIFASSCSIYDFLNSKDSVKTEDDFVDPVLPYSLSKYKAENKLKELADDNFCVVILRKGTVFGYSPRMRFDLVVNTMVKDAFSKKTINVVDEGLHWRPLVDVENAAEAYCVCVEANSDLVNRQVFNISLDNFQVKDIATTIQTTLDKNFGVKTKIEFIKASGKIRSYRVSNDKARKVLKFEAKMSIPQSVEKIASHIKNGDISDFQNPIYYNIDWMKPIFEREGV
ncbi:MAG: SDR family oxidoreductase [Candidatus Curtissbacteria bacterium]|nr:SDR family oxidoreductase [Candidatus Curtissbacteria bacterium]